MQAVEKARAENIGYLLAVGGGSVLDGTKFVAAAIPYKGDAWDIPMSQAKIDSAVPLGAVLTLSATGSEMNCFSVVSHKEKKLKKGWANEKVYPQFSVLDPKVTYSLPDRQVLNGVVDPFVHVTEQYLTYPSQAMVQDNFSEGVLRTLIHYGPRALSEKENYEVRSNLMWAASNALNGLIGSGVPQDWATHMIGHELTVLYGLDHAQTLAVVLPSLLRYKVDKKEEKLAQFAEAVWNIKDGSPREKALGAIDRTEQFFRDVGVKTKLSEYSVAQDAPQVVASRLDSAALGEHRDIKRDDIEAILKMAF